MSPVVSAAAPRILVIGRQGQVARAFQDLGRDGVVCAGRPDVDVTDFDSVVRAIARAEADVVVNPAAYTAVDTAESEPERAFAVNETGAGNVARAAADAGLPVVHISTDYVFDGAKGAPYAPEDAPDPLNVYGRSKLAGEAAVAAANPRHVIVRTAWVYGPHGTNFAKTMLRLGGERDALSIVDDQRGNPTAARDVAAALAEVAARAVSPNELGDSDSAWGTYHVAGAEDATWFDFAAAIFDASKTRGGPSPTLRPIATADRPTPARRPLDTRLATSRGGLMAGLGAAGYRERIGEVVERLLAADAVA